MVEVEEVDAGFETARRKRFFSWLVTVFVRPGKAMREIASEDRSVWWLPMLLLTVLTLASVLVAGPLRKEKALNAQIQTPDSFQWMTPEQQEQYMQAQKSGAELPKTHIFPAIGSLVGLWLGWFLLGALLHLILTMLGSRSTNNTIYNIAAWASMPIAIRLIVQIVAMLTTHQLISSPGVSGFLPVDVKGALVFARILLTLVDFYLIWQFILLLVGAFSTSGLTRGKAFSGVLISVLLLLGLSALPGFLAAQLSGLNVSQSFFFF